MLRKSIKIISLIMAFTLLVNATGITTSAASTPKWKTAYMKILKKGQYTSKNGGFDYYKSYFGENFKYKEYFLCDVNKDGTPELFLVGTQGLTVIISFDGKPIFLGYDNIYKINKSKKAIVVKGHWHGAGGSGYKEYSVYNIKNSTLKNTCNIDKLGSEYYIYVNPVSLKGTKKNYLKYYKKYVDKGKEFSKFKKYKRSNIKGLNVFQ